MRERLTKVIRSCEGRVPVPKAMYPEDTSKYISQYIADVLLSNGALLPLCKLGGYVYRMEKYNGENKIFRYKVTGVSYELHGDEISPLYSARCEELEDYATERLMFFESAVGKTVFLAEEDVEGADTK